jgi:hypothetical protein
VPISGVAAVDAMPAASGALTNPAPSSSKAAWAVDQVALAMGGGPAGTRVTRRLSVHNLGNQPLHLGRMAVTGESAGEFDLAGDCQEGRAVPAGQTCQVEVSRTARLTGESVMASLLVQVNRGGRGLGNKLAAFERSITCHGPAAQGGRPRAGSSAGRGQRACGRGHCAQDSDAAEPEPAGVTALDVAARRAGQQGLECQPAGQPQWLYRRAGAGVRSPMRAVAQLSAHGPGAARGVAVYAGAQRVAGVEAPRRGAGDSRRPCGGTAWGDHLPGQPCRGATSSVRGGHQRGCCGSQGGGRGRERGWVPNRDQRSFRMSRTSFRPPAGVVLQPGHPVDRHRSRCGRVHIAGDDGRRRCRTQGAADGGRRPLAEDQ